VVSGVCGVSGVSATIKWHRERKEERTKDTQKQRQKVTAQESCLQILFFIGESGQIP